MRIITGATRALITVAATGAAISVGVLSGAAPAGAHVRVDADHAAPGWTARLDRGAATGAVRSVTWTAAPGTGISSGQVALFRISVRLPDGDTVRFPATQTYSDGTVVRWDQEPLPDGGEPEHPAPELTPSAAEPATPEAPQAAPAKDDSARWLAGGALTVAAVRSPLLPRRC